MANSNSTTDVVNLVLTELSNQIQDISATLAGVSPSLRMLRDGVITPEDGNVLSLVGRMTDNLNAELCSIADKLSAISIAHG